MQLAFSSMGPSSSWVALLDIPLEMGATVTRSMSTCNSPNHGGSCLQDSAKVPVKVWHSWFLHPPSQSVHLSSTWWPLVESTGMQRFRLCTAHHKHCSYNDQKLNKCPSYKMIESYSRLDGVGGALSSDVTLTSLDLNMQIPQCLQSLGSLIKKTKSSCSAALTDGKKWIDCCAVQVMKDKHFQFQIGCPTCVVESKKPMWERITAMSASDMTRVRPTFISQSKT